MWVWWTYQTGYKSAYFPKLGRLVPEFGELGYFVIGTRTWWTRVPSEVPDSTKLEYQSAYFENRQIGTPSLVLICLLLSRQINSSFNLKRLRKC